MSASPSSAVTDDSVLRDSAAVAPGEDHYFQDTERHHWFHANNLWIDLGVLARHLGERGGISGSADHRQPQDRRPDPAAEHPVIQIESSMGAAVEALRRGRGRWPSTAAGSARSRRRTSCCSARSDLYRLTPRVRGRVDDHPPGPFIDLGPAYRHVEGFEQRFPRGIPSIRDCTSRRMRRPTRRSAPTSCAPVTCG